MKCCDPSFFQQRYMDLLSDIRGTSRTLSMQMNSGHNASTISRRLAAPHLCGFVRPHKGSMCGTPDNLIIVVWRLRDIQVVGRILESSTAHCKQTADFTCCTLHRACDGHVALHSSGPGARVCERQLGANKWRPPETL